MNHSFKFTFYGLRCQCNSSAQGFCSVLRQKFRGFTKQATHPLLSGSVNITFENAYQLPNKDGKKISAMVTLKGDQIHFTHQYLSTQSIISISFADDVLTKIAIAYHPTFLFTVLNFLSGSLLETQLFQQLIKLYVEQTLFWYTAKVRGLSCIHASAVEKEGNVFIFAGMNGVGKSTLAQQLTQAYGFHFYADNYLLVDKKNAYFAPDTVRLDKKSLQVTHKKSSGTYGFGKYTVEIRDPSPYKKARIKKMYLVSLGNVWHKKRVPRDIFWQSLLFLQSIHGEMISLAPVAQINTKPIPTLVTGEDIHYYDLEIGRNQQFDQVYL